MNTDISILSALIAGIVTFLAPCTFVTVPTFMTYLASQAFDQTDTENSGLRTKHVLLSTLAYILGFSIVFTALGLTAGGVSSFLISNRDTMLNFSALIIIVLGAFMIWGDRIPRLRFLFVNRNIDFQASDATGSKLFPFFIGITSGLAWTPCIGPILGAILLLASNTGSALQGGVLLFIYSLGIGIPFIIVALFLDSLTPYIQRSSKYISGLPKLTGWLLIIIGLSYVFGFYEDIYAFMYRLYGDIGWSGPSDLQ